MVHTFEQIVWLGLAIFLSAVLFVLFNHWRKYKETRAKILREHSLRKGAPFDVQSHQEKAQQIFKGEELKRAQDFLNEAEKVVTQSKNYEKESEGNAKNFLFVVVLGVALGIAYALFRFFKVS